MGIIKTLLFFAGVIYLLVRFAGWLLRFFRKNAGNEEEAGIQLDIPESDIDFAFPGGDAEIEAETQELYLLLLEAHPKDLVRLVLVGGAVYFAHLEDKSESKIVAYIQQLSGSAFTPLEAEVIHDFIYTRVLRVQYQGQVDEDDFRGVRQRCARADRVRRRRGARRVRSVRVCHHQPGTGQRSDLE
jgi:hypothetical protein